MLLAALALLAAAPPKATTVPTPQGPVTEVAPMTVYPPSPQPKLVASYPAEGGAVTPGIVVLKLTFDQKMLRTGFDIAPAAGSGALASNSATPPAAAEPPLCVKTPRLLDDGKTFVLLCTLRAGRTYAFAINGGPAGGFANISEHRAGPGSLTFTTTRDDPVRSLDEAMKLDGLGALDVPVQESPID